MTDTAGQLVPTSAGAGSIIADSYSAFQLRSDRWNELGEVAEELLSKLDNPETRTRCLDSIGHLIEVLTPVESYWAFPGSGTMGQLRRLREREQHAEFAGAVRRIARAISSGAFRKRAVSIFAEDEESDADGDDSTLSIEDSTPSRLYFEVLIVDSLSEHQRTILSNSLHKVRRPEDPFIYEIVIVPSLEDAVVAALFNHNIQTVVVRSGLALKSTNTHDFVTSYLSRFHNSMDADHMRPSQYGPETCRLIKKLRPELDAYLVTDRSVEDMAAQDLAWVERVFYNQEDFFELHLNILRGLNRRYRTPFFSALKEYSRQPTGVFHALPISRGKSISRSHWIQDMGAFYGPNIFLAETSATSGGLDSLLEPRGPIKEAQEHAARAFGARKTFFVTNGTSTSNKVVVQALIRPGDIVLVDRDCHKSHHYGLVLVGAQVVYLDSYPLHDYSMYGAVPVSEIKRKLLRLRAEGLLDRVRMVLLTNCTFDGLVYDVARVQEECLAIKSDLIFLWDEAWYGFARFNPAYRQRTAMQCAQELRHTLRTENRAAAWADQQAALEGAGDEAWLSRRLVAPPDARVRVYATQSTHKTLTSLRQGSMIHIHDQDFRGETEQSFHEAYMTHTSTSPNYQIIASLDVGRRQVELEGFEFVQKQIECAMSIRRAVAASPLLQRYFKVLTVEDMIPETYRESGVRAYHHQDQGKGWADALEIWRRDEFVLDPTKVTLLVAGTGYDGATFKTDVLMRKYGIQINKTSRNTVLFLTNIGTTRSSVAYLIEILMDFAHELDDTFGHASQMEQRRFENRVRALAREVPPLPDFSAFHPAFLPNGGEAGDLRAAFFLAYEQSNCDYVQLDGSVLALLDQGETVVSASFVIPYPPGFPILVPGQVISRDIVDFMRALDTGEIHGYRPDLGLRIFRPEALGHRIGASGGAGGAGPAAEGTGGVPPEAAE